MSATIAFGAHRSRPALHSGSVLGAWAAVGWPARLVAGYVLALPLVAGIPRGSVVPMLRLTELIQLALTAVALSLAALAYGRGRRWRLQIRPVDWWMVALAFAGSILPLVSLSARGEAIDPSLLADSLPLFKYLLLYVLARLAITGPADAEAVLLATVGAGVVVAGLAIQEGLGIGPVGGLVRSLVSTNEIEGRAYTMLGSPLSTGAFVSIAAAVALGYAATRRGTGVAAVAGVMVTGLLMVAAVATGQMTSVLAFGLTVAVAARCHRVVLTGLAWALPAALVGAVAAVPIVEHRLADVSGRSMIPQSWVMRWVNVSELYWPEIVDGGWLIGVSPRTVLVPPDTWRTEVYLESGYLWTLWVGGLPLLIALVGFLAAAASSVARREIGPVAEIARGAALATIAFMVVFNLIDPYLTLRGGADMLYVLVPVAMAATPLALEDTRRRDAAALLATPDRRPLSASGRIQIGELGGDLLAECGWAAGASAPGDRGLDLCVRDAGVVRAEGRVYFIADGRHLDGLMLHPARAADDEAAALLWRGIARTCGSMRLRSLLVPPGLGLAELDRHELRGMAAEADRLESQRLADPARVEPSAGSNRHRRVAAVPTGVRLSAPGNISRSRRALDLVLSATALVLLAPLLVVVAIAVRRSGPGPILFRQMRVGAAGLPFRMLKFRTMAHGADDTLHRESIEASLASAEAEPKLSDDPRVTPVGRLLRTTSIDELPQLLNVLRGEMTLVGPRPSLLWETSLYDPPARVRLALRPGIAGLWQASGRGDLSVEEMLDLDRDYAARTNLWFDLRLLGSTLIAVLARRGAR